MTRTAFLLACLIGWMAIDASAQTAPRGKDAPPEGVMNAVSFGPLPSKAPIAVRPLDDSEANLRLKTLLEGELRTKGFDVVDSAPLVMTFETSDEIGAWTDSGQRSLIELQARGGREGGEDAHAILNIYNSTRGGLLNEGHGGTSITTPSTFRISITIDNRGNGKRLWQGWTIAALDKGDRDALSRAMVPVLMGNLGLTVSRQPFIIQ